MTGDAGTAAPMRLYDTARREVVPFTPGPLVTMYTCGITPYDATHIGHAATYLTYDVLQRRLRDRGHDTRCVRNITDVDDDLLRKARELGVHYLDLAAAETARFDDDMRALELLPALERAPCHVGHPRHPGLHRHGPRPGLRLPGRRRRLLRRLPASTGSARSATSAATRCWRSPPSAAATSTTPTSATRSTSCCGSRRPTTSRRGSRCGARADRAGTSSARRWPCASWAPRSTCTAAAPT